jgi:hypothetical protein
VPGLSGRHSVGGRFRPTLTTYTCWLKGSCKAKLRPRRGGAFVEDSRRQLERHHGGQHRYRSPGDVDHRVPVGRVRDRMVHWSGYFFTTDVTG